MTTEELTLKCKELDTLIRENIVSDIEETGPILDGVFDPERFLSAKYKILWILKEPYDQFDEDGVPFGGGWHLKEAILPKNSITEFTGGRNTFEPMIYVSWGILNGFTLWNDMEYVNNDPDMLEALKSIAYINVKKLPGYTSSSYSVISEAYQNHKDILLRQIHIIDPDIIIGGSTLHLFLNDLKLSPNDKVMNKNLDCYIRGNKIYIDAYHPAQRPGSTGVNQQMYCDQIITAVESFVRSDDFRKKLK